jgi:uncharacterized protein YraI
MSLIRYVAAAGAAVGMCILPIVADAAITHTTSNLNLRTGPSTAYPVQHVIPAGSSIDIHSCGAEWCSVFWGGVHGYVAGRYLISHVTVAVVPLTHVMTTHHVVVVH